MNWLDDVLKDNPIAEGEPEEITLAVLMDGVIKASTGEEIAELKMNLSTTATKWQLKIPAHQWENIVIICDGNALEVNTEPMSDSRYKVKRTLRGLKPTTVVKESELELREFESTKDFMNWIEGLDNDTIEALRQMYFDQWNFSTASQRDRMYYELLEEEKKGRR